MTILFGVLLVAAAALLVTHFALDAGSGREAPRVVLPVATCLAFAAILVSILGRGKNSEQ